MRVEKTIPASQVKKLQELVCAYNLRWLFNPYPILAGRPEGNWRVGIDYSNVSMEKANEFDLTWLSLTRPINETYRRYSWLDKLKQKLKRS